MKIILRSSDCVALLKTMMENSVTAILCDPPYGLEFIEELQDKSRNLMNPNSLADIARKEEYGNSYKGRVSKLPDLGKFGQYGKQVEDWHMGWVSECFRVLKPQGTLRAFSASKTAHRLIPAFDRCGFSKVNLDMWLYKSGMPKARNLGAFEGWYTQLKPCYEPIVTGIKIV